MDFYFYELILRNTRFLSFNELLKRGFGRSVYYLLPSLTT